VACQTAYSDAHEACRAARPAAVTPAAIYFIPAPVDRHDNVRCAMKECGDAAFVSLRYRTRKSREQMFQNDTLPQSN
jgi:hypothetical protein